MNQQQKIIHLIEWIRFYPSGENCQPFSFSLDLNCLRICYDETLDRGLINHSGNPSRITLGCILYLVEIVGQAYGLKVESENIDHDQISAVIYFSSIAPDLNPLLMTVRSRRTVRSPFTHFLPSQEIDRITANIKTHDRVRIQSSPLTADIFNTLVESESTIFKSTDLLNELMEWIRIDGSAFWTDGLLASDVGISKLEATMLKFLHSRLPWIFSALVRLRILSFRATPTLRKQLASAQRFVSFSLKRGEKPDYKNLVEIGRAAMETWLKLSHQGFGLQPLSYSSLLPLEIHFFGLSAKSLDDSAISKTRLQLRRILGLSENFELVWIFRVGTQSQSMTGVRRSVKEFIKTDNVKNTDNQIGAV